MLRVKSYQVASIVPFARVHSGNISRRSSQQDTARAEKGGFRNERGGRLASAHMTTNQGVYESQPAKLPLFPAPYRPIAAAGSEV